MKNTVITLKIATVSDGRHKETVLAVSTAEVRCLRPELNEKQAKAILAQLKEYPWEWEAVVEALINEEKHR